MSIYSTPFGPTILTGKDADAFEAQIADSKPNPLAQASIERGRAALISMARKGLLPETPHQKAIRMARNEFEAEQRVCPPRSPRA